MNVNLKQVKIIGAGLVLVGLLSGCSSMKLPDMDFIKFPEFKEEAENIPDYPKVSNAPAVPTSIRSAEEWDQSATGLMAIREGFVHPDKADPRTDAQIQSDMKALADKVDAYKADDPQ